MDRGGGKPSEIERNWIEYFSTNIVDSNISSNCFVSVIRKGRSIQTFPDFVVDGLVALHGGVLQQNFRVGRKMRLRLFGQRHGAIEELMRAEKQESSQGLTWGRLHMRDEGLENKDTSSL